MNELVNFARQVVERRSGEGKKDSMATPSSEVQGSDWLSRWRELARLTDGLLPEDPRFDPILTALSDCDRAFKAQDLDAFTKGTERVRRLMQFTPGAKVRWEGTVNHRLCTLGPATVELVHHDEGKLFAFVVWRGIERWISETIITKIEGTTR